MTTFKKNESGMVSITITVVLMVVISITVLSFAQIIRSEQRQALDKQLSSQAYYAAESGVNAARTVIQNEYIQSGQPVPNKTTCEPPSAGDTYGALDGKLDDDTQTGYPCLLINSAPKLLKYELSTTSTSKVVPVDTDGVTIDKVTLAWTPSTQSSPLAGCPTSPVIAANSLKSSASWPCNGYGIIRIDLVPMNATMDRASLMRNTFTAFATPTNNTSPTPATVPYNVPAFNILGSPVNEGARPAAYCTAVSCRLTITGLAVNGPVKYYARVLTLYRNTTLSVGAQNSSGTDLSLKNAQVVIDSTGKATDVLRRIQVHIPLVSDGLHPDYGIETTDSMCKQMVTFPTYPIGSMGC